MKKRLFSTLFVFAFLLFSIYLIRNLYLSQKTIAIQKAIEACNPAYGLLQIEPPYKNDAHIDIYWGSLVWEVEMKGKWQLVGGPAPDPNNPGPFYWDECTIIIHALTGKVLSTPIE